ncbi:MAG: hypothetical protein FJX74_04445 [Armatimonadetes bacterium]|nr:hypothetical protein [Armatimonadota bacterium]
MYTSLEIKGFRCFKHLSIPKLARLNLIGGKNNTGKTALLEGVRVLGGVAWDPAAVLGDLYYPRGFGEGEVAALGASALAASLPEGAPIAFAGQASPVGWPASVTLSRTPGGPWDLGIEVDGHLHAAVQFGPLMGHHEEEAPGCRIILVPSRDRFTKARMSRLFGGLQKRRKTDLVLNALKRLEPAVEAVQMIMIGDEPVLHLDLGGPELLPAPLVGEGMNRVCEIVLAEVAAARGILLVDEIENGLHYSVMADVWRTVADTAVDLDVQVFATTHSHECVEAAYAATEGMPEDTFLYHRLDRVGDDIECQTYSPRGLEIALQTGNEVR